MNRSRHARVCLLRRSQHVMILEPVLISFLWFSVWIPAIPAAPRLLSASSPPVTASERF